MATGPGSLMYERVGNIVRRPPVTVPPMATLRAALMTMDKERVGSVVAVDADNRPLGILTLQDVLRRVALPGTDMAQPVAGIMSRGIVTVPEDSTVYAAALLMARRRFRHLPVVDTAGKLTGVVSANQLHDPVGGEMDDLVRRINEATDQAALLELAPRIRQLAVTLVGRDAGAGILNQVLSSLNDLLSTRVISLIERRHRLPPASWCWLALGSEGRVEQTFATDQDNGLVFSAADPTEAEALRPLFLAFAREVNGALAACGFPLCHGEVMAGNEKWCLSLDEWRQRFTSWVLTPEPMSLLFATIFFDFRVLYGEEALGAVLREHLQRIAPSAPGFLLMMAANAVEATPPLGLLRDFVAEEGQDGRVDLKKSGSRLFVDAARIFALAAGAAPVNTAARLRAAGPVLKLNANDMEASLLAFHHLQKIRLLHQHRQIAVGQEADNLVDPDSLNSFDRRMLLESLKQARRLQQSLKMMFRLEP